MALSPSLSRPSYGLPGGNWRWAALGFVFIALIAGGIAVGAPEFSRWAGFVLLVGIGSVALVFLFAIWPNPSARLADAQRLATAAAQAHIAWAITGKDGAVLDCNEAYRKLAHIAEGEIPPPPELALSGASSSSVLYRLARGAIDGVVPELGLAEQGVDRHGPARGLVVEAGGAAEQGHQGRVGGEPREESRAEGQQRVRVAHGVASGTSSSTSQTRSRPRSSGSETARIAKRPPSVVCDGTATPDSWSRMRISRLTASRSIPGAA